jgi:uncharacterized ion transporter superfamily protein YfcC
LAAEDPLRRRISEEIAGATVLTRSQHAKLIAVIVVMTIAIVWLAVYGARVAAETRALRCQHRYAAARTAADSATVDSLHPQQDSPITCGRLRLAGAAVLLDRSFVG